MTKTQLPTAMIDLGGQFGAIPFWRIIRVASLPQDCCGESRCLLVYEDSGGTTETVELYGQSKTSVLMIIAEQTAVPSVTNIFTKSMEG
jgi:hypothetical protein